MKDIGCANAILGVKIIKTSNRLILNQSHYIDTILKKFNKDDSSVVKISLDVNFYLSKNKGDSASQIRYSKVFGSLMYLMSYTRLNIAYTISKLSGYTNNSSVDH